MQFSLQLYHGVKSPNEKMHWVKSYRINKQVAQEFRMRASSEKVPREIETHALVTITRVGREMDMDNLIAACKHIRDTIADWLVPGKAAGQADASRQITWQYCQRKPIRDEDVKLEIDIELL